MKSALLLLCLSLLGLSSCSSEYNERLLKAKELKMEIVKTMQNRYLIGVAAAEQIAELQEEINFHAKVSGNEELFKDQLEKE